MTGAASGSKFLNHKILLYNLSKLFKGPYYGILCEIKIRVKTFILYLSHWLEHNYTTVRGSITYIDKNIVDDTKFQLYPLIDGWRIILGGAGDLSFPANSGSRADKSSISPSNYPTLQYICSRLAVLCEYCCYVKNKKYECAAWPGGANIGAVCVTVFI